MSVGQNQRKRPLALEREGEGKAGRLKQTSLSVWWQKAENTSTGRLLFSL